MKNLALTVIIAYVLISASACRKPTVKGNIPAIQITSVTIQRNGAVRVEGVAEGDERELTDAGFYVSKKSNSDKPENRFSATFKDKNFFTTIDSWEFEKNTIYNFKAWVNYARKIEYSSQNTISQDSIGPVPGCLKQYNTITTGEDSTIFPYVTGSELFNTTTGLTELSRTTVYGPAVELRFGSTLQEGIYTTVDKMPHAGTRDVYVYFSYPSDAQPRVLNAGSTVQVNLKGNGSGEIVICDAPWKFNQKIYQFSTRLGFGVIE